MLQVFDFSSPSKTYNISIGSVDGAVLKYKSTSDLVMLVRSDVIEMWSILLADMGTHLSVSPSIAKLTMTGVVELK